MINYILETYYEEVCQADGCLVSTLGVWDESPVGVEVDDEVGEKTADEGVKESKGWLDGRTRDEKVSDGTSLAASVALGRNILVEAMEDWKRRENVVE